MVDEQITPKPKHRFWRPFWHVLRISGLLAILPVVFAAVAALLLIDRDIDAPDWLKSRIEQRASLALNGGQLTFDSIFIAIGRDLHPRVRLQETEILDASGMLVARIPVIEGLISPRGVLFDGSVLMQDVALKGAQINVNRAKDGSVSLVFGGSGPKSAPSFAALLDQSVKLFEAPALAALEEISATGVVVNYSDARAGRSWTVDGGVIDLELRGGQTAMRGAFTVLSGGAAITQLTFQFDHAQGADEAVIGVSITDALARDIASQSDALRWLAEVDAPISAALRTTLNEKGALGPLSATLELGAGALQPNAETDPIGFDSAKAYMTYDPASQLISFDQVEIDAPAGRVAASGRAYLREFESGVPQALVAQIAFSDVTLAQGGLYPQGLTLPPLSVDARLRFAPFAVEIGQLALADGETHLTAQGRISAAPDGWEVAVNGALDQIDAARFVALWPESLKPRSRLWMVENVSAGMLTDTQFDFRTVQGAPPAITARFEFEGATARYMRDMPLLQGAVGVGNLLDNQLIVSLDAGRVPAPQGGAIDLTGTAITILDTRVRGGNAALDLRMDGTITATLALLDSERFQFISKAGQSVDIADGRATVEGYLQFPLRKGVPPEEVELDIAAAMTNLRSDTVIKGRRLTASRLDVLVDNDGVQISGPAQLDGIAANGTWRRAFGAAEAGKSQLTTTVTLSQPLLDAFGIALPAGALGGEGQADLTLDLVENQAPAFRLTSDLRGVSVGLPAIGWRKEPNARGALLVTGTLEAVPRVDRLEISGGGLDAKGSIRLTPAGALDEARFTQVRIGNWMNAPITVSGRGKGQPVGVSLSGGMLDLRGASFGGTGGNGTQLGPMSLRLDRLQITEGITLRDFRGDFSGTGGFSGAFTGHVNDGPLLRGTVVPQNGRSAVRLVSNDAGGVVGAAGFVKNGVGGTLDLTLLPVGAAGTFDGTLAVRGLRVRDAPSIAALLDAISVVGLVQQLDGGGLAFDEVDATFRLTPDHVIVTEASAVGPGLGISIDGIYALASKQIDFQGVVSPFYLINSIGSFLTRKGEGLIGFNFNLTGSAASPNVSVNPLSALTPGMFRELFRRPPPEVSQ